MIKKRNMLGQIGLIIITFGIYGIYWFYKISEEMKYVGKDMEASPALWTVLLFVPFAGLWSYYKFSELYEKVSPDHFNKWILWLLWVVFAPAVWFIVQTEMNRKADHLADYFLYCSRPHHKHNDCRTKAKQKQNQVLRHF